MEQVYIDIDALQKGRKSIARMDGDIKEDPEKSKLDQLAENLGVQNFKTDLIVNVIKKAGIAHLPEGAERFTYTPTSEYGVIYIPINRLKQVYQTDKAIHEGKVASNKEKMKQGVKLDPVIIGYNYDVHDGHHRIEAAEQLGYTHVPCKVVGTDPQKVREAKRKYRDTWKSLQTDVDYELVKSLDSDLENLVLKNREDETKAIESYSYLLDKITDPEVREVVEEILGDEKDHFHNLQQVLKYIKGDEEALKKITKSLALVMDLSKGGQLHRSKLVKRRIPVKGKNGTFYREQWVDPHADIPGAQTHHGEGNAEEHTYQHHEDGIKDMERAQSNKFPVRHMSVKELRNTIHNYSQDKQAYQEALARYHNGEKLPPVKVTPTGEILNNHHLVDMAKNLGLTHVPVIIVGNPKLKKELEDRLKDKVYQEQQKEDGSKEKVAINAKPDKNSDETGVPLGDEVIKDVERFRNVTAHMYTHDYIMQQAKTQDIVWAEYKKDGTPLPANSNILWMNAMMAIEKHIKSGAPFMVERNENDIDKRMNMDKKDSVHKYFLRVLEKFNGDKDSLMEWCRSHGINWRENTDPSKNWMLAVGAVKDALSKGKMVNGIRTRQKDVMEDSVQVSDQVKARVKALGQKHGKDTVMIRAVELGITFNAFDAKGEPLPANSNILWMRASEAIQKYIAKGNEFTVDGAYDPSAAGITATVGDYGNVKLSRIQKYALDWAKRNSQDFEPTAKKYALECFKIDRGLEGTDAEALYDKFMENARKARVLVQFDPFEKLPSGVSLLEQLTSDGQFKNDYYLNRGFDAEHREANEADVFGIDYNEASHSERPNYGIIDLFNVGLNANPYAGDVAFVLKKDDGVTKRATGIYQDSDNLPYMSGVDRGKWVRSLEDPHHLLIDRWYSRWEEPYKADKQRVRAMNAVIDGVPHTDDKKYFEAHLHGGLDFKRDVDHILVPSSWQTDKQHASKHTKLQEFAKLQGLPIKYE